MEKFYAIRQMQILFALFCLSSAAIAQGQPPVPPQTRHFVNLCPVPPSVEPSGPNGDIDITVDSSLHNFSPSVAGSVGFPVMAYNYNSPGAVAAPAPNPSGTMTYLGPTMIWNKNQPLTINVTNHLNKETTTHWHGANLKAEFDGGPQEIINANGGTYNPSWTVRDSVTTHWYHSHLMDFTTEQVGRGLAGFIIVQDPANDPFYSDVPHNYGYNDFPLVIQEKGFMFDSLSPTTYEANEIDYGQNGGKPANQYYTPVNGVIHPILHVPHSVTRFRFLNGSVRKSFQFGISAKWINPAHQKKPFTGQDVVQMHQIATDGGYVPAPFVIDSVLMGPGERVEVVVDFSTFSPGDTVYLVNLQRTLPSGVIGVSGTGAQNTQIATQDSAFMAFVVDASLVPPDPITMSQIPSAFWPHDIDTTHINKRRTKILTNGQLGGIWTIDGHPMDMHVINDTVLVNSREIWTIWNTTTVAHPFHIHKTEFKVIDIFDTQSQTYLFNAFSPNPNLALKPLLGDKDVVMVMPNCMLRFVANFDSFPNTSIDMDSAFMYHCHILTHEDQAMMHQFIVVDTATWNSFYLGNNAHNHGSLFTLYPNPTDGMITLKGKSEEVGEVCVVDQLGRIVWKQTVQPFHHSTTLDLGGVNSGLYFIEWKSATMHWADRVVLRQ